MAELSLYILKMFLLWFVCTYLSLKLGMLWEKTETAKYRQELGHSLVLLTNIGTVRSWRGITVDSVGDYDNGIQWCVRALSSRNITSRLV